ASPLNPDGTPIRPVVNVDPAQSVTKQLTAAAKPTKVLDQAAAKELESLRRVQREIESYAQSHGFADRVQTNINERGLVVRLLTDELLCDTGKAVVKRASFPLLAKISSLLRAQDIVNPVRVEGNTDTVPISTAQFRSNWELSTSRATAVLQFLLASHIAPS